jgi:hypothetical protein
MNRRDIAYESINLISFWLFVAMVIYWMGVFG